MNHVALILLIAAAIVSPAQTFVCGKSRTGATLLTASSIYSATTPGFDLQTLPQVDSTSCSSDKPFFFSVALPEGAGLPLRKYLTNDLPDFNPAAPDSIGNFSLPATPIPSKTADTTKISQY
jgi:hypothetical protein